MQGERAKTSMTPRRQQRRVPSESRLPVRLRYSQQFKKSGMRPGKLLSITLLLGFGCTGDEARDAQALGTRLSIRQDEQAGTISIFRENATEPLLVQNARAGFRPYLHPIMAPDGKGVLTENNPAHHPHQTGLYWGFTRVNGRDFFHHPEASHWRRVSATVMEALGDVVRWQTVYDLLDESGAPILRAPGMLFSSVRTWL